MIKYLLILIVYLFIIADYCSSQSEDSVRSAYSGYINFAGLYQSGNTNKFLVQGKGELKNAGKYLETILYLSGSYGENKSSKDDNTYYLSLTTDLFYRNIFSPFALQYLEYNYSKGIEIRSQTGAGGKYIFISAVNHKSSVSLALIYEYLNLVQEPGITQSSNLRFSLRIKSKQMIINKRLNIKLLGYYQPDITDFSNSNIYAEVVLEIPMTKMIKLNANYNYNFDNEVSVGRKRADNKLTFGAGLNF